MKYVDLRLLDDGGFNFILRENEYFAAQLSESNNFFKLNCYVCPIQQPNVDKNRIKHSSNCLLNAVNVLSTLDKDLVI